MTRPDWWTWLAAVEAAVPNEGVYATALVWGRSCWDWRRGALSDGQRARPVREDELGRLHPAGGVVDRTIRRRIRALVDAGLLERIRGHSRWSPDTYAPTLPNTGQRGPELSDNTGHGRPDLEPNTGHQGPVLGGNTGHPTTQHRTPDDRPLFSPEVPETPRARTHTRTREEGARTGGISPEGEEAMRTLLRALDYGHGDGMSARLAPGWRQQVGVRLSQLRAAGWPEGDLIERITRREFASAGSIGRVLVARLEDLAAEPVPTTAAQRAEERAERAHLRAVSTCPHGTPGGSSACALCRRGDDPPPDDEDHGGSVPRPASREEAVALARISVRQR